MRVVPLYCFFHSVITDVTNHRPLLTSTTYSLKNKIAEIERHIEKERHRGKGGGGEGGRGGGGRDGGRGGGGGGGDTFWDLCAKNGCNPKIEAWPSART